MKPTHWPVVFSLVIACSCGGVAQAQDRAAKVRRDRETITADGRWIYDDFGRARELAAEQKKPILAVLRCVP